MEPDFWHERWRHAEIGFHQPEINEHLQRFWTRLASQPGQRVFVPLCGKSRDLLWLAGAGHPVIGVEISPIAVEAFFRENELQPRRWRDGAFEVWDAAEIRILLGDFFALEPRHVADVATVYDRAALIALPLVMRGGYARHLDAILPPASVETLLVTLEYDQSELAGPPFAVDEAEVRALYEPAHAVELLYARDALAEESPWRARGLTWLLEKAYRLSRRLRAAG